MTGDTTGFFIIHGVHHIWAIVSGLAAVMEGAGGVLRQRRRAEARS